MCGKFLARIFSAAACKIPPFAASLLAADQARGRLDASWPKRSPDQ